MIDLHATANVSGATFAEIETAAAFYSMEVQEFIDAALTSGLSHACKLVESADESPPDEDELCLEDDGEPEDLGPPADFLPKMAAAFDALHHNVLAPLIDKTQGEGEQGETLRMTINLPKEWMILAAWTEIHGLMRENGRLEPMPNAISTDTRLAHWHRAKSYISRHLHNYFHEVLHLWATHSHPYLYMPQSERTRPFPNSRPGEGKEFKPSPEDVATVPPEILHAANLKAEYFDLNGLMRDPRFRRMQGQPATIPVQFALPEEWLMLAGWQERKLRLHAEGDASPCSMEGLAQSPEARDYLRRVMQYDFDDTVRQMDEGHHVLFQLPRIYSDTEDDFPF